MKKTILFWISCCFWGNMLFAQNEGMTGVTSRENERLLQEKAARDRNIVSDRPLPEDPVPVKPVSLAHYGRPGKHAMGSRGSSSTAWWSIDAGWGHRLGTVYEGKTPDMSRFSEKMRTGWQLTTSLIWFFDEYFGVGAEYTLFHAEHSGHDLWINPYTAGDISQKINIHYIGPEVVGRYRHHQDKNACWISLLFGYGIYRENTSALNEEQKVKGGAFVANAAVGYDLGISRHFGIGLKIHWGNGRMYHYQMNVERDPLGKKIKESLSTVGVTVGIRFRS